MTPVVVHLAATGADLAARLGEAFGTAPEPLGADAAPRLRAHFAAGRPIVAVMAAGALIRILAPMLADKTTEPPVVAVGADCAIPLLGGHHGANALAARAAEAIGGQAAITTASDQRLGVAPDDPGPLWRLANAMDAKAATVAILAGRPVALEGSPPFPPRAGAGAPVTFAATLKPETGAPDRLVYHPRQVALGVGCERLASPDAMDALVSSVLAEAGIAAGAVAGVYSIALKADEPAMHALAAQLDAPFRVFSTDRLAQEEPRLANPSEYVRDTVGVAGVAEAAALAAAGPDARLIAEKHATGGCTAALALAPAPFDGAATGRPQGRLFIVGLGPGAPAFRAPAASAALDAADLIVGYDLYLDLLSPWEKAGKDVHTAPLGAEEARAAAALDAAAEGRSVALISSGDAGIYAMAAVVYELLDRSDNPDWRRVAVETVPGISAMQLLAARFGAPMGHDFCAVSFSDLLTSAETIERRLEAAASGDFVTALYNPVSARRRALLPRAREIFRAHRPADTPVLHARALGRPDERLWVTTLEQMSLTAVDMLTILMIGATATKIFEGAGGATRAYTPRGYRIGG